MGDSVADRNPIRPHPHGEEDESARSVSAGDALKRTIDLVGGASLLVLLSPLLLVVAIAIVVDSGRPVFFRCRRVGRHGRPLQMLKFRKMGQDAAGPLLTVDDDPRFTRVGQFLARTKLDELPQLWHVVRGDMSLVGPRPEDPHFVALHGEPYQQIHRVKPGITGLAQLAFAEESRILGTGDPNAAYLERLLPQKLMLDCLYAAERSTGMDLSILWWTARAVVLRRQVAVDRATGRLSRRRRDVLMTTDPVLPGGDR